MLMKSGGSRRGGGLPREGPGLWVRQILEGARGSPTQLHQRSCLRRQIGPEGGLLRRTPRRRLHWCLCDRHLRPTQPIRLKGCSKHYSTKFPNSALKSVILHFRMRLNWSNVLRVSLTALPVPLSPETIADIHQPLVLFPQRISRRQSRRQLSTQPESRPRIRGFEKDWMDRSRAECSGRLVGMVILH